jgi:hypothetical protein
MLAHASGAPGTGGARVRETRPACPRARGEHEHRCGLGAHLAMGSQDIEVGVDWRTSL